MENPSYPVTRSSDMILMRVLMSIVYQLLIFYIFVYSFGLVMVFYYSDLKLEIFNSFHDFVERLSLMTYSDLVTMVSKALCPV